MGWGKMALASFLYFMMGSSGQVWAGQIDSGTYMRLQRGMSEGEVLARAGVPDKETYFDSEAQRTTESIKQLLYIPGPEEADPHLTIITIQGGKVLDIERIKMFSPPKKDTGGQMDSEIFIRLQLGMSEGEVLTRAGSPDKEVYLGTLAEGANESIRQLLYMPGSSESDPYLTVITVQRGEVINIERTKIFSR